MTRSYSGVNFLDMLFAASKVCRHRRQGMAAGGVLGGREEEGVCCVEGVWKAGGRGKARSCFGRKGELGKEVLESGSGRGRVGGARLKHLMLCYHLRLGFVGTLSFGQGSAACCQSTPACQCSLVSCCCPPTQEELGRVHATVDDAVYRCHGLQIVHPLLRAWMGVPDGKDVFHDVQVRDNMVKEGRHIAKITCMSCCTRSPYCCGVSTIGRIGDSSTHA